MIPIVTLPITLRWRDDAGAGPSVWRMRSAEEARAWQRWLNHNMDPTLGRPYLRARDVLPRPQWWEYEW